ncbi:Signal transduction histidine kinase [Halopseudomonas sabulinigri]|uniref:histidine kinase n=1 Tax=Halopseudomonas sabulinigri TaxID=472181 RepID=A0A1H1T1X0_9GAMM|nr:sensor histidine kinase [Halopseudomonas sabulinigri]SDS53966.1 Signal transduction histidine kinase [Halopseudomonas sabulinigri]
MSLLPRSKPGRSIRTTLLCWLLPFAAVFMGVAWFLHGVLLERMAQDFVRERLQQEAAFMEQHLRSASSGEARQRIWQQASQSTGAHHLYAVRLADSELFSHPQWRLQLQPWLEQTQPGLQTLSAQLPAHTARSQFLAYRISTQLDGRPLVIVVAEDVSVLKAGEHKLHLWTAIVAIALLLVLIGMILLAVHLALRPTTQLRYQLQQLRQGSRSRLDDQVPAEFQKLIQQLNQLLDTLDQRLEHSRQAHANLSHSVKTPIAAITQMMNNSKAPMTAEIRLQIVSKLAEINRQLDSAMRCTRTAGPQLGKTAKAVNQTREMLWMIGRLHPHKHFELDIQGDESQSWPIEEQDLNELLGNLIDNAGKWAHSQVRVQLRQDAQTFEIAVADDGAGVAEDQLEQLGTRGMRLDQQMPGHGIGLAIVRDIAARYGATLSFARSAQGGLLARIRLPCRP